jgi:hypothetical protein
MRQGRGDADYSSLFRQYFPSGSPLGGQPNGEDDQPRLAGIDEGRTPEPEKVPVAVETTAEVPSEAKAMGEVVQAPAADAPPAEATVEAAPQEVAGHNVIASAPTPATSEESVATPAPADTPVAAEAAVLAESQAREETVLTFPTPAKEEEGEEPRGLWGGFWRRRTDD